MKIPSAIHKSPDQCNVPTLPCCEGRVCKLLGRGFLNHAKSFFAFQGLPSISFQLSVGVKFIIALQLVTGFCCVMTWKEATRAVDSEFWASGWKKYLSAFSWKMIYGRWISRTWNLHHNGNLYDSQSVIYIRKNESQCRILRQHRNGINYHVRLLGSKRSRGSRLKAAKR